MIERRIKSEGRGAFRFQNLFVGNLEEFCMNCNENKRDRVSWGDREINR
jgi:hypothetical protein